MPTIAERILGGVNSTALRSYCGHFVPEDGTLTLESNNFPIVGDWFSLGFNLSAAALDDGDVRVSYGLVSFDPSYTETVYYSSDNCPRYRITAVSTVPGNITFTVDTPHTLAIDEQVFIQNVTGITPGVYRINAVTQYTFTVDSSVSFTTSEIATTGLAIGRKLQHLSNGSATAGFLNFRGLYETPTDAPEMCFRLEVRNCAEFWIDNVLVDPHEGQYQYFDGNSTNTFSDDYRWMGDRKNRHFSLWYNNYKNTHNRLFSDWDTEEQVYKSGLVEEWAPTGANIVDHWNAVTSFTPSNWHGSAFYPLHEGMTVLVSNIDTRLDSDRNVIPEPPTAADWDDSVVTWDSVGTIWDAGEWE